MPTQPSQSSDCRAWFLAAAIAIGLFSHGLSACSSSSSSDLSDLTISSGTLSPGFSPNTTTYSTLFVGASTITVTPTVADSASTLYVNGIQVANGSSSDEIDVSAGDTTITVDVVSNDMLSSKTYSITARQISQQAYAKASNTGTSDQFSHSLAIDGNTLVVGSPFESGNGNGVNPAAQNDNSAIDSGAVYVFTRASGVWTQQAYIKASNTEAGDQFGWSVAISGDTLVVGAIGESSSATGTTADLAGQGDNGATDSGAVYVFTRSGSTWTQQTYLKPSNTGSGDLFGWSLALSGDTLAVSANGEDSAGTGVNAPLQGDNNAPNSGAVYLFTRASGVWTQQSYVKASNADPDDQFGSSIALHGDTLVVGAPSEDSWGVGVNVAVQGDNSAANSGAAYVFQRNSGVWTQEAYLKASNTGADDQFGTSVAIAGDTVVVGAAQEDGNGTGVNPNTQGNNGATDSGAVYVFTRSGSTWAQQAYLKPSNTGAGDRFGDSITLAGDTLAVGAPFEDSIGVGISPVAESDNSAANSGAVYVFGRTSDAWRQDVYLKASNTGSGDMFGSAISLAGDSLAVGAPEEDGAGTGINPGITSEADNSAANSGGVYVFR